MELDVSLHCVEVGTYGHVITAMRLASESLCETVLQNVVLFRRFLTEELRAYIHWRRKRRARWGVVVPLDFYS